MKYLIHKAIEVRKLAAKALLRKCLDANPLYLEENFIAQPKHDGCNCILIFDGNSVSAMSRTGEPTFCINSMHGEFLKRIGAPAGVYLGEAWNANMEFKEISGVFRRKSFNIETDPLMQLVVFDYLTIEEWREGKSTLSYKARVARLGTFLSIPHLFKSAPVTPIVGFGILRHKWSAATGQDIANKLVAAGGFDGLVFRDPDGRWRQDDPGTQGEIIKVKPLIRVSCRVTGFVPGEGKYTGKVGSLLVEYKGKEQGAGTGLRDDERFPEKFESQWLGQIVEIEALGETPDGYLREPRLKGVRTDVVEPD